MPPFARMTSRALAGIQGSLACAKSRKAFIGIPALSRHLMLTALASSYFLASDLAWGAPTQASTTSSALDAAEANDTAEANVTAEATVTAEVFNSIPRDQRTDKSVPKHGKPIALTNPLPPSYHPRGFFHAMGAAQGQFLFEASAFISGVPSETIGSELALAPFIDFGVKYGLANSVSAKLQFHGNWLMNRLDGTLDYHAYFAPHWSISMEVGLGFGFGFADFAWDTQTTMLRAEALGYLTFGYDIERYLFTMMVQPLLVLGQFDYIGGERVPQHPMAPTQGLKFRFASETFISGTSLLAFGFDLTISTADYHAWMLHPDDNRMRIYPALFGGYEF